MAEKDKETEVVVKAMRLARELSATIEEARTMGVRLDVEVDRVNIAGRSPLVQVMIYPVTLGSSDTRKQG